MGDDSPKRRHVWVTGSGGYQHPGLIIGWRRTDQGGWEAYVARSHGDGEVLVTWEPAANVQPVTDERWQVEESTRIR